MEVFNFTNWPAIRDFVTTLHHDSYDFISPLKADLGGKSVFIAGATRGIGKSIAASFARAGCSHIAVGGRGDLSAVEAEVLAAAREAGRGAPEVLGVTVDVSSEESVAAAAERISAAFGGSLDVLVISAGVAHSMTPLAESDPAEWWRTWEVNVKGVYLCTKTFIPLVLRSSLRTIITVSTAGAHMLTPGLDGYQTGKFALCRLTEFVDDRYREQGLITMTVHPGDVITDMADVVPEEIRRFMLDKPQLAGDTLVWLAKEKRTWLGGRFINCCWDMREFEAKQEEVVKKDLLKFRMVV